jgi:predicted nucleotidyltransferase
MIIPNENMGLLDTWKANPFGEYSISEIMKISGKKTKPWVFNALKLLTEQSLLTLVKKGNINIYRLNLKNPCLVHALHYLEAQKSFSFPLLELIVEVIDTIPLKNYCLLVFGSYAESKQKKDSDLDVCILVESKTTEKRIRPYFNEIKLNYPVTIDEHYITFDDFVKMLLSDEENLGKQIFRKHRIFFNPDIYYQLIKEAHKHGFRP